MRLSILIILFFLCFTASAQAPLRSDESIKVISFKLKESYNLNDQRKLTYFQNNNNYSGSTGPDRIVLKPFNGTRIYDGLILKDEYREKIFDKIGLPFNRKTIKIVKSLKFKV